MTTQPTEHSDAYLRGLIEASRPRWYQRLPWPVQRSAFHVADCIGSKLVRAAVALDRVPLR